MFNLIIKGNKSWTSSRELFEKSRVLEYTEEYVKQRFMPNQTLDIHEVTKIPTVFACETSYQIPEPNAQVGMLTSVQLSGDNFCLEYLFDSEIPPIPISVLYSELAKDLDITMDSRRLNENSRNHWAIKDVDLFKVLLKHGIGQQPKPKVFNLSNRRQEDLVAVMMPFDAKFDPVYTKLKEVIKAEGMACKRADDFWQNDHIIQDIVTLICEASIVICDLTGRNTNVFYESGIAHTLGRDTILITQSGNDIPFDLRPIRFIEYHGNTEGINKLGTELTSRLQTLKARM